ncbi:hypothetical protein AAMO2058_001513200 [Amorphochlora amoebiformis]|mmetsp:Transcript_25664/g.40572  ORF Transcript_25664/g.40572 Transcript_25664/m.40572 type:complete len:109 (+) Transcript_25664:260-586(+)
MELQKVLKPFATVTSTLSGTKYCTASLVLIMWKRLIKTLEKLRLNVRNLSIRRTISSLLQFLGHMWDKHMTAEMNSVWIRASTVDPNFKNLSFLPLLDWGFGTLSLTW